MKIIGNTYEHKSLEFKVEVTTCNKKIATTKNLSTGETVKFNRGKFEFMIQKGVFNQVDSDQ